MGKGNVAQRFVQWLSAPGTPNDLSIHQELLQTLQVHPGLILSGGAYVLMMSITYALLQNLIVGLSLSAVTILVTAFRVQMARTVRARRKWNQQDAGAVFASAFIWAPVAALTGSVCASSGQSLLLVMSAFMITGLAFGTSYINAAAPHFAKLLVAFNLLPFLFTVGCLHLPHMRWIVVQTPLWMGATFFVIDKAYSARAELIHAQQKATFLAFHDQLTGLANRSKIMTELSLTFGDAVSRSSYILYLDLDGFKSVNDAFGHSAGDELLCAVAARLTRSMREMDLLGRIGGDEFIIVLKDLSSMQVEEVAERVVQILAEPFDLLAAKNVHISVSIGGALLDTSSVNSVLEKADSRLYAAKRAGKGAVRLMDEPFLTNILVGDKLASSR